MTSVDIAPRTQRITSSKAFRIVFALCFLAILFDGIDTFMYGATIPSMVADKPFGMTEAHAGTIGSFATFGMLVGALTIGMVTDALGRRMGILFCSIVFSVSSALCAVASTAGAFGFWRTLAGFGLGGLLPTAIAMVSEYSPEHVRSFAVGAVMAGHQAGGIVAPLLSIGLLPALGWRSMYWVGVLPLVLLVPLVLALMPESITFLVAKGRTEKARVTAERFDLIVPLNENKVGERTGSFGHNFAKLFRGRNALVTVLFWCGSFGGLLLVYGMSTWLPSLMKNMGFDLGSSLALLCVINAGGLLGNLAAGRLADQWGPVRISMMWFVITACGLLLMSINVSMVVSYLVVFLTGIFLFSAQIMIYAAVSHVFPTETRGTALGLTTGIGRFGAVFGPWLGGHLLASGLGQWGFATFAGFGVSSALMMLLIWIALRSHGGRTKEAADETAAQAVIQVDPSA